MRICRLFLPTQSENTWTIDHGGVTTRVALQPQDGGMETWTGLLYPTCALRRPANLCPVLTRLQQPSTVCKEEITHIAES